MDNNKIGDFNFSDNGFVLAEEQPSNVDLSSANVEEDFINKRRKEMPKVNMRNPFVSPNDNSFNNDNPTTVKPPIVSSGYTGRIIETDYTHNATDEKPDELNSTGNSQYVEDNDVIIPVNNDKEDVKIGNKKNLQLEDNISVTDTNLEKDVEVVNEEQKPKQSFFKKIFNIK